MMKRLVTSALAVFALLALFTSTTLAQSAATPEDGSLFELLRPVYEAFARGQHVYAGALALVAAVILARRHLAPRVPFFGTALGGAVTTFATSFVVTVAAKLADASFSLTIVRNALDVALYAAGGFSLLKPIFVALVPYMPNWLSAIVLMIFEPGKTAVAKAEKDGQAAVDAKPPGGATDVIGKPADVP